MIFSLKSCIRLLVWIYCLSWCFDYRGETQGGGAFQALTFLITAGSGALVMLLGYRQLLMKPGTYLLMLWGAFMVSTLVVALYNHVAFGVFFRNSLPPLLMTLSMGVTLVAAGAGLSHRDVLHPMLIASAINIVWRVVYILVLVGKPIDMVRVEILSQSMPFVLGYVFATLFLEKRINWPAIGLGLLCLFVYVLSVTRSAALIMVAEIFAAFLAMLFCWRMRRLPQGYLGAKKKQMAFLAAGMGVVVLLFLTAGWFIIERWIERTTRPVGSDYLKDDPSKLTRYAEHVAFYKIMKENPHSWLLGMGVGHNYYWDESYHPELAYTYGNLDIFRHEIRIVNWDGHSMWTYAIFSGGALGFLVHIVFFLGSLAWAWFCCRRLRGSPRFPLAIAWTPFVGQFGFLSLSLTFNPFIERASMMCFGILICMPQFLAMAKYYPQACLEKE
jgi:hypothetical protein